MIDHYQFGSMTIEGKIYNVDLKILRGEVIADWWRKRGHELAAEDVTDILKIRPTVLVVGKGSPGQMRVLPDLKSSLGELGIELRELPTPQAVEIFNELHEQGTDVAAAFHLTC